MNRKLLASLTSLTLFVLFVAVWQLAAANTHIAFLFGSPSALVSKLIELTLSGDLPSAFFVTAFETIIGFAIGITFGTTAGFALWYSPFLAQISRPYILFLGAVPVFAFAPMIIIWFGIGFWMKVALAGFAVFLVALAQAYAGAQSINEDEYRLLKTYGATRFQMFQKVIFPASLSWVLASMKLNIGFAILGAFVGEFISSSEGLGHIMVVAGSLYDIPTVLAAGLYLVLLSAILGGLVFLLEKNRMRVINWFS